MILITLTSLTIAFIVAIYLLAIIWKGTPDETTTHRLREETNCSVRKSVLET